MRTRASLDEQLARRAQAAGAKLLEGTTVTGPVLDDSGRVVGVETTAEVEEKSKSRSRFDNAERVHGSSVTYRARVVVAADGNSSRLSVAMGLRKRDDRPMGVAVRTYYTSPRHKDDYLESWLDLWDGDRLLPGYGWIFGMGDGTSNVGLGMLNTSDAFGKTDYRELLKRWLRSMPEEWGYVEENRTEPVRGAALPMGFNRTPHYHKGLLLAGDAAGMVNPFNGEGIAYAMESGELLARVVAQALARPTRAEAERVLRSYPEELQARLRPLLHARPGLRPAPRQAQADALRDKSRHEPPAADAVRPEAAGQPDRPAGRRRQRPRHQRHDPTRTELQVTRCLG